MISSAPGTGARPAITSSCQGCKPSALRLRASPLAFRPTPFACLPPPRPRAPKPASPAATGFRFIPDIAFGGTGWSSGSCSFPNAGHAPHVWEEELEELPGALAS